MIHSSLVMQAVLALMALKWLAQLALEELNQRHVRAHAAAVPAAYRSLMDFETYARSVQYTLAQGRFSQVESTCDLAVLLVVLTSGVLPWGYGLVLASLGTSAWSVAAYLFLVGLGFALARLPLDWSAQFRLEGRFGFNTSTPRLWWLDRIKGLALAGLLGYPLLVLILKTVEWAGRAWWLWAWGSVLAFQLLMIVFAPVLILPLFNRFTQLPEGGLRQRLLALAKRTGFQVRGVQVMDGSKRSRHSNAFFTGLGRLRKIVLFDTLIEQLRESELEAVVAHEIGHGRLRHIPRMLLWSAVSLLAGFGAIAWLARQDEFYRAFGFPPGDLGPAILLFTLLSGAVTFWFTPLTHYWTRRYEYQADAFAERTMGEADSLIGALRKLSEKNLSNLTPHPIYSAFYYSHPTLTEREGALAKPGPLRSSRIAPNRTDEREP